MAEATTAGRPPELARERGATTHCFRIRFRLGNHVKIQTTDLEWSFDDADGGQVVLYGVDPTQPPPIPPSISIGDARSLVLRGAGYPSADAAQAAAARWLAVMQAAFARVDLGADFGTRAPQSAFTPYGLHQQEVQTGKRLLNDVHGSMTFECDPPPGFISWPMEMTVGKSPESLRRAIEGALSKGHVMTLRQQMAYDLFGASFFTVTADARFMMLMMAVETLIEPQPRADEVRRHVFSLIETTERSGLDPKEVQSLIGSLRWLLNESISRAGRRLARSLGDRRYMDEPVETFFSRCYDMRSSLAHGQLPRPSRDAVDVRAASLEVFTGHLICGDLLNAVSDG
jgi:hypothetical protein